MPDGDRHAIGEARRVQPQHRDCRVQWRARQRCGGSASISAASRMIPPGSRPSCAMFWPGAGARTDGIGDARGLHKGAPALRGPYLLPWPPASRQGPAHRADLPRSGPRAPPRSAIGSSGAISAASDLRPQEIGDLVVQVKMPSPRLEKIARRKISEPNPASSWRRCKVGHIVVYIIRQHQRKGARTLLRYENPVMS